MSAKQQHAAIDAALSENSIGDFSTIFLRRLTAG